MNTLSHSSNESITSENGSISSIYESSMGWFVLSIKGLYEFIQYNDLALRAGFEPTLNIFLEHKSFFDDHTIYESEILLGLNVVLNCEYNNIAQSAFGLNLNFIYGYIPETNLSVDRNKYESSRPFDAFNFFQTQFGITYSYK